MTEALQHSDPACPGENWFLYWRTSSSLWRSKIENMPGGKRIIIPLNWSFHSENGDQIDFGNEKPESNLCRLIEMARECNREVHFFIPITPAPFLPNGGPPHLLARQVAISENYLSYALLDSLGQLNKIHSFFDPRIFQGFTKFLQQLAAYFLKNKVSAKIWAIECGHIEDGEFHSFLFDRSKIYTQAFTRYMSLAKEDAPDLEKTLSSVSFEKKMNRRFLWTIRDLYLNAVKTELANYWEGQLQYSFMGSSPCDFLERGSGVININKYSEDLLSSLCLDIIPSSILIPNVAKKDIYNRLVEELVNHSYVGHKLDEAQYEDYRFIYFSSLVLFNLYIPDEKVPSQSHLVEWENPRRIEGKWKMQGLLPFIKRKFSHSYHLLPIHKFKFDESSNQTKRINIIDGELVDQKIFNNCLKIFMSGGLIILDRSTVPSFFNKKLESFFLENGLNVEKVFFHTNIQSITLGEGKILLYDGQLLNAKDEGEKKEFWEKIISFFDLVHIQEMQGDEVNYFWRTRASSPSELNYEEVRRLSLYNGSSYKKKIKIPLLKNFVLMKILDELNAVVQSYPHQIEIQLMPEGAVSLDFGVFGL